MNDGHVSENEFNEFDGVYTGNFVWLNSHLGIIQNHKNYRRKWEDSRRKWIILQTTSWNKYMDSSQILEE